ncbi:hypothetical protein Glove_295g15 [Diversispora epigaea]|uniref:Uncharacterized protein n=1 Tax=Diversispora epigaea TaxID=1348612 RepID=A0A397I3J3_9GLOM|nr:hypothetical protein Glove_295g15 [Diversispora epigaea]
MASLSAKLAGITLPVNKFRSHLNSQEIVVDEELARQNFEYLGKKLCDIWKRDNIHGKPVNVEYIDQERHPFNESEPLISAPDAAIFLDDNNEFLLPIMKRKDGHFTNPIHTLQRRNQNTPKSTQKQTETEIDCVFIRPNLNYNVAEDLIPRRNSWPEVEQIFREVQSDEKQIYCSCHCPFLLSTTVVIFVINHCCVAFVLGCVAAVVTMNIDSPEAEELTFNQKRDLLFNSSERKEGVPSNKHRKTKIQAIKNYRPPAILNAVKEYASEKMDLGTNIKELRLKEVTNIKYKVRGAFDAHLIETKLVNGADF